MFTTKMEVNISRALGRLDRLAKVQEIVLPELKSTAGRIIVILRKRTPASNSSYDPLSGQLKRAWVALYSVDAAAGKATVHFKNTDPRAPWLLKYLIKGTRPHVIRAKNASALLLPLRDGTLRFAPLVHHPGTKAVNLGFKEITGEVAGMKERVIAALKGAA